MWDLRKTLIVFCILLSSWKANGQNLIYTFIDPCTKETTLFAVPAQGTVIFFLNQSRSFTPGDVANGTLASWVNQVYSDYRKISPCGVQSGQVNQNLITSQIIGSTVQSVVSSIMSSATSASVGGTDAASKGNTQSDNKKQKNENNNNNNNSNSVSNSSTNRSSTSTSGTTQGTQTGGNNNSSTTTNSGTGNNNNTGTGNSGNPGSGSTTSQNSQSGDSKNKGEDKGEEVGATTTMNVDARQDKGSESGGGGGGSKGGNKSNNARNNPVIVSSDLTTAQNLDKTFTPILNLGMSQSSMTGMSSWGLTSMTWLNFKQFALSGRYTQIHFNKTGSLKFIHNFNLTGVYSYGNILAFVGYSGILNAGKWGVTGFNISAAGTLVSEEDNTYFSPSITAFYTRPFKTGKRLIISPEIYVISTPLIYSSKDKVTTTDRYFSGFLGSGFDYQITKRFKFNMNYKANLSTNPEFPILSFFLIGSKINL
jgi:hypothetical protein